MGWRSSPNNKACSCQRHPDALPIVEQLGLKVLHLACCNAAVEVALLVWGVFGCVFYHCRALAWTFSVYSFPGCNSWDLLEVDGQGNSVTLACHGASGVLSELTMVQSSGDILIRDWYIRDLGLQCKPLGLQDPRPFTWMCVYTYICVYVSI